MLYNVISVILEREVILMKELIHGSFIILVFKIFGAISLFSIYMLIPQYYDVKTFGVFNLVFMLLVLFSMIARMGLDTYILKIVSSVEKDSTTVSLFLKRVLTIVFFNSMGVSILILLFSYPIDTYIFKSVDASPYIIGLSLIIFPYTLFNVLPEVFRALDDIKRYSFFRNFSQNFILFSLLSISILFSLKYDPVFLLYGTILIIIIPLVILLYKFLREKSINIFQRGKYEQKILKYSYPMFFTASTIFFMSYTDSFMISYYLDEYQVGLYSACVSLSMMLTFIPMAIGSYISTKVSQAYSNNEFHQIRKIFKNSFIIISATTIPVYLIMYIFDDFFLGLFGKDFLSVTTPLLIINTAALLEALTGTVGFILDMTNNQHKFMKILFIALFINLVLNLLLIPIYGIIGAAIAMLVAMSFRTVSSVLVLRRQDLI